MPLVTVDDVATRLGWPLTDDEQTKAAAFIEDCTILVEDWTGKDFDLRADQSFYVVADGGCFLPLPRRVLPYLQITLVLVDGVEVTDWAWEPRCFSLYRDLGWSGLVTITGSWGFPTPPPALKVAICAEVIRWMAVSPGIEMERTGEREVQYSASPSQSLSEAVKSALRSWRPSVGSLSLTREDC